MLDLVGPIEVTSTPNGYKRGPHLCDFGEKACPCRSCESDHLNRSTTILHVLEMSLLEPATSSPMTLPRTHGVCSGDPKHLKCNRYRELTHNIDEN